MDKSSENKLYSGLLIYRLQRNVEYLLLNDSFTNKKHWFFPEGEVKGKEDEVKCALRETNELIRLNPQDLHVETFKIQYKYLVGNTVKRINIYFAQMVENHMRLPPGADGIHYMWCNTATAVEKITTRSIDVVFKRAQELIENKIKTNPPQVRRPRVSNDDHRPRSAAPARPDQQRVDGMVTHQRSSPQQPSQRRQPENLLYKTRLCERFEKDRTCSYGAKCHFAHGINELRERVHEEERPARQSSDAPPVGNDSKFNNRLYKTKLCDRYHKEKFCQYGPKCHFAHGQKELRELPADFDHNYIRPIEEEYMRPSRYRQELKRRQQDAEAADGTWQTRAPNNDDKRDGINGKSPIQNGWSPTANPWSNMQNPWKTEKPSSTSSSNNSNDNDNDGWPKAEAAPKNTNGWSNTNNTTADNSTTNSIKPDKENNSKPVSEPKPVPTPPPVERKPLVERKPVAERASYSDSSDSSDSHSLASERTNTPSREVNGKAYTEDPTKSWMKVVVLSREEQKILDESSPATSPSPGPNKTNPEDALINELRNVFKQYPGKSGVESGTMRPDVKAVTKMEMRNDLPKRQLLFIILASMFDEGDCRVTTKIEARLPLFTTFVKSDSDERMLLKAWEKLVTGRMPSLLQRTNHMCSAFYQHDILSEEVFDAWYKALDEDNKVKRNANKFREWLMSEDD
ncbi:hypothetical protein BJV82DRAFT_633429 [Fennellomyces sp. T-0311]|nr:hypothetical protein BJV82DRAFT_633429 [Fennellomyces sp. T-0311]